MKWKALALLLILGLAVLSAPSRAQDEIELEDEDDVDEEVEETAFLLVRRHVKDVRPLEGRPFKVTIELYNAGHVAATNVWANDTDFPEMIAKVDGEVEGHFDSIAAGATVQFSYDLTLPDAGPFTMPPVKVSYQLLANDAKLQTTKTSVTQFYVVTFTQHLQLRALEWGGKLTLGYISTVNQWMRTFYITGGATAVWFGLKTYRSIKATSEKRKRQKALEELQKMQ